MSKPRDAHRKHQQLMTELDILNTRIRAYEQRMRRERGKLSRHDWDSLVAGLRKLNRDKEALNRKFKKLGE